MRGQPRRSAPSIWLSRAGLPPSRVAGVRMALEPGRGRTAVPVRTTLLAAVVGVAAVAAALTITASADRLLGTPRLYGHNWDAVIGNGTDPNSSDAVRRPSAAQTGRSRSLRAAPSTRPAWGAGRPGVLAMDNLRGSLLADAGRGPGPGRDERDRARHEDGRRARRRRRRPGRRAHRRPLRSRSASWAAACCRRSVIGGTRPRRARRGRRDDLRGAAAARLRKRRATSSSSSWRPAPTGERRSPDSQRDASAAVSGPARRRGQLGPRQRVPLRARGADRRRGGGCARARARHLHPTPAARPRDPQDAGLRAPRRARDRRLAGDDGRGDRPPRSGCRSGSGSAASRGTSSPRSSASSPSRWRRSGRASWSSRRRSCSPTWSRCCPAVLRPARDRRWS